MSLMHTDVASGLLCPFLRFTCRGHLERQVDLCPTQCGIAMTTESQKKKKNYGYGVFIATDV